MVVAAKIETVRRAVDVERSALALNALGYLDRAIAILGASSFPDTKRRQRCRRTWPPHSVASTMPALDHYL
jgi:hypothetical protein